MVTDLKGFAAKEAAVDLAAAFELAVEQTSIVPIRPNPPHRIHFPGLAMAMIWPAQAVWDCQRMTSMKSLCCHVISVVPMPSSCSASPLHSGTPRPASP